MLAVGAGGGCVDIFSLVYHFSLLSPSLWETARYRLKYCLEEPYVKPKTTNQPTYEIKNISFLTFYVAFITTFSERLSVFFVVVQFLNDDTSEI